MIFPANAKRRKAVFPHALHSAAWRKRNGTEFVSMNRPRAKKTTMFAMPASESRPCSSRDARKEGNGLCAGMCERCWLRFPFEHPYRDDKETDVAHVADTMHGCIVDARSAGDGLTIPAGWMRDSIVRDNMR